MTHGINVSLMLIETFDCLAVYCLHWLVFTSPLLPPQLGRYWSREERKRHLEKERERRRRHELLRRQQQQQQPQQPQAQPAQPQAPPAHLPHEEPAAPPPRPSTLENGLHQALWRDHSSRRKTSATLDASHRKMSSSRKRDVEEPAYGVRTPMVPLNPPPPPHQANQQMVKGLLSVTTV